jgi:hypothetical protein
VRTFDALLQPPLGLSRSPARRSPTSKDLGSSHRGAAPLQSRVPPLTARLGSPGSPSWVSTPFNGIRPRAPFVGQVVRDPPRLRSRAFSAPQRLMQACVPRPCFVPQPFLDCVPSSVPLPGIAYPSQGSFATLRLSTCVQDAPTTTLSPTASTNSLAPGADPPAGSPKRTDLAANASFRDAFASFPRRLWTPIPESL